MSPVFSWQTLLFVPVGADRHLESAIRHRPDAVILDLEDAIAPDDKEAARSRVRDNQARLAAAGIASVVRVNGPLAMMAADIASLDRSRVAALLVPKCETSRPLENAADLAGPEIGMIALIETPLGVERLAAIADTSRLCGLMLGSEDLSAALGVNPDGGALTLPAAQLAIAAAARGLLAIGFAGSIANFRDLNLYRTQITQARNLGMNAVAAIHPAQLPVIREALAPEDSEIAWAEKLIGAMGAPKSGAVGAVDGMMIDAPVLARARLLLSRRQSGKQ